MKSDGVHIRPATPLAGKHSDVSPTLVEGTTCRVAAVEAWRQRARVTLDTTGMMHEKKIYRVAWMAGKRKKNRSNEAEAINEA